MQNALFFKWYIKLTFLLSFHVEVKYFCITLDSRWQSGRISWTTFSSWREEARSTSGAGASQQPPGSCWALHPSSLRFHLTGPLASRRTAHAMGTWGPLSQSWGNKNLAGERVQPGRATPGSGASSLLVNAAHGRGRQEGASFWPCSTSLGAASSPYGTRSMRIF